MKDLRVQILIYDGKIGSPDSPIIKRDEPLYGDDELEIIAATTMRQLRKYIETDS